jgi:hypothetical protein
VNRVPGANGTYSGQADLASLIPTLLEKMGSLIENITIFIEQNRNGGGRGKSAEQATPAETDPSTDGGYFGGYSF